MYTDQETKIEKYTASFVEKNNIEPEAVSRQGGANKITITEGSGEELVDGGLVSLYIAGYVFNGNIAPKDLFFTNHKASAEEAKWDTTTGDYDIITMTLDKKKLIKGLYDGLYGIKAGEECLLLFSGKYGFGKKKNSIIPGNSALAYKVWVESISNE